MEIIRTSASMAISIFACLALLLTPDFPRKEESLGITRSSLRDSVPASEPQASTSIERKQAVPEIPTDTPIVSPSEPEELTDSPEFAQSTDWIRMMYPELHRIEKLESHSARSALDELAPMLSSDDPSVRLAAIESIGDMTLPNVLTILSTALNDPDPLVRVTAVEALASGDDEAAASSIEAYLYDDNRNVRSAAIAALAELEAESAVPALAGLLSDRDPMIRRQAVYALGDIGGRDAMMYLLQARYDASAAIRIDAEAILAELEYEAAF